MVRMMKLMRLWAFSSPRAQARPERLATAQHALPAALYRSGAVGALRCLEPVHKRLPERHGSQKRARKHGFRPARSLRHLARDVREICPDTMLDARCSSLQRQRARFVGCSDHRLSFNFCEQNVFFDRCLPIDCHFVVPPTYHGQSPASGRQVPPA